MEIEPGEEEIELKQIADEILEIHPSKKTLTNSLHSLIIEFEAHLDTIIKRYKTMSITLLIATGAAIGFSFSGELKEVQVNKLIMASIVCFFGMIGLLSIWYLDIHVFHKFWGSFFVEEVKMEERHSFLVDVGDVTVALKSLKARLLGDGNWYIFLNVILLAVAAAALSFIWDSLFVKIGIFCAAAIVAFFLTRLMLRTAKKLLIAIEQMLLENPDQ
jgi:hypothetical protein